MNSNTIIQWYYCQLLALLLTFTTLCSVFAFWIRLALFWLLKTFNILFVSSVAIQRHPKLFIKRFFRLQRLFFFYYFACVSTFVWCRWNRVFPQTVSSAPQGDRRLITTERKKRGIRTGWEHLFRHLQASWALLWLKCLFNKYEILVIVLRSIQINWFNE